MTCHDARELFSALIDETLTRDERADVYGHLATCADCRRELASVERTVRLIRGATPMRAPAGFVDRVIAATRPTPWYVRATRAAFLPWPVKLPLSAAAILLVAGLAVLMFRGVEEQQRGARQEPAPPSFADPSSRLERPEQERARAKRSDQTSVEPAAPAQAPEKVASTERAESRPVDAGQNGADGPETRAAEADSGASAPPLAQSPPPPSDDRQTSVASRADAPRAMAKASGPPDVVVRLASPERETAERALAALAARLAGAQTGRRVVGDTVVVDVTIPRERYGDFAREAARFGDYRTESEASSLPDTVRIAVHLDP